MRDGLQGVPHDRWLMRIRDYLAIFLSLAALVEGGYKLVRRVDQMTEQISILQQQVSVLQQLVVSDKSQR